MLARCALLSFALLPAASVAEPIKLKLAYFSSDRDAPYMAVLKPFVDAVNKDAKGILEVQIYPGGVLGRSYAQQAQLVLDGTADMAWVNPSLTPELFADVAVMQLPGLFRDLKEATMAYTSHHGYGEVERLRKILRDRFIRQFSIDDPYALAFRLPCRLAGKENPGKQPHRGRDTGDSRNKVGCLAG